MNGLADELGIDITHLFATPLTSIHATAHEIIVLGFCGILPPGIDAKGQQPLLEVLPIGGSGFGIKEVDPVGFWDIVAVALHLLSHHRAFVDL